MSQAGMKIYDLRKKLIVKPQHTTTVSRRRRIKLVQNN
jgi:hypothetical protein